MSAKQMSCLTLDPRLRAPLPRVSSDGSGRRWWGLCVGAYCSAGARILAASDTMLTWGTCYEFPWCEPLFQLPSSSF